MHNPEFFLENETHKLPGDFEIQTDHLKRARWPHLGIINKKKRTCRIVNFTVLADHRVKIKESEKRDKYLDLARKLKKLWNVMVTVIPISISALGTIPKGLIKGLDELKIRGREETIQTTALLKLAIMLRRVLETWGDMIYLKLLWKTICPRWCKKHSKS